MHALMTVPTDSGTNSMFECTLECLGRARPSRVLARSASSWPLVRALSTCRTHPPSTCDIEPTFTLVSW